MTTATGVAGTGTGRGPLLPLGRSFVHPAFDLMLIGGGLSLLTVFGLQATGSLSPYAFGSTYFPVILLLANGSHFAASTVRLYSKPDSFRDLPVMTMVLPVVSVAVLTLALVFADTIGRNLFALYLTWSPYHYAAQTYGLAAMYAMRSGCRVDDPERNLLWWTCMLPFLYAFVSAPNAGIGWVLPPVFFVDHPALLAFRNACIEVLMLATFVAPLVLVTRVYRRVGSGLPLISVLLIVTNGVWWVTFSYLQAFAWATVFHGIQYLAIVIIFHLRDHPAPAGGRWGWLLPTLKFYGICVAVAYGLFEVWPFFYAWLGFPFAQSMLLCVAVINIHHFIVDRGIWRVRRDPNYRIVVNTGGSARG